VFSRRLSWRALVRLQYFLGEHAHGLAKTDSAICMVQTLVSTEIVGRRRTLFQHAVSLCGEFCLPSTATSLYSLLCGLDDGSGELFLVKRGETSQKAWLRILIRVEKLTGCSLFHLGVPYATVDSRSTTQHQRQQGGFSKRQQKWIVKSCTGPDFKLSKFVLRHDTATLNSRLKP
jgi:hypothetical protein